MREAPLPPAEVPAFERSVAACLAAILESDTAAVPLPPEGHPRPWTVWREWLAEQQLALVPVRDPAGFGFPGPWIAVLRASGGDGDVAAVAFGSPPGIAWHPLGGPEAFDAVREGYVVVPADVAGWLRPAEPPARTTGRVELLAVAAEACAPMAARGRVTARAGRGLEGDRYFGGRGTFSDPHGVGHDLTLIEAEALEALAAGGAAELAPEAARRNVVTRGIDLEALIGRRFRIGGAECIGRRRCEPCSHLERLTTTGVLRGLVHRGGLRADVVADGEIRVGDTVAPA
jgi:hypothetical protein